MRMNLLGIIVYNSSVKRWNIFFQASFWIIILLVIISAFASFFYLSRAPEVGFYFAKKNGKWVSTTEDSASGIKKGDILKSMEWVDASKIKSPHQIYSRLIGGEKLYLMVNRGGKEVILTTTVEKKYSIIFMGLVFLLGALLISLGVYSFLKKPFEESSLLLGAGSLALALILFSFYPYKLWMMIIYFVSLFFSSAFWMHLSIEEFSSLLSQKTRRTLPVLFYLFSSFAAAYSVFYSIFIFTGRKSLLKWKSTMFSIMWVLIIISALIFVGIMVMPFLLKNIEHLSLRDRVKFKFLSFTITIGVLPIILILHPIQELSHGPAHLEALIFSLGVPFILFLPFGFAIPILRKEPLRLENYITKSKLYLVLTGLFIIIYAGLIYLATEFLGYSSHFKFFLYLLFFLLGFLLYPIKEHMEKIVKSKLDVGGYSFEDIVEKFNSEILIHPDGKNIINRFYEIITETFKLKSYFLFIAESYEFYKYTKSYNLSSRADESIKKYGGRLLRSSKENIHFLSEKEKGKVLPLLKKEGIEVLIFIKSYGKNWGLLGLGKKGTGGIYNPRDLALLKVLSTDLSLGIEAIKLLKKGEGERTSKLRKIILSIEKEKRKFEEFSFSDDLTGVFNRRYFMKTLNYEMERSRRFDEEISLILIDIDSFKEINDKFGHSCGDKVLKSVASDILKLIRSLDVLARYGGDEFAILLIRTNEKNTRKIANKIRMSASSLVVNCKKRTLKTSLSIGIYSNNFSKKDETLEIFMEKADRALYFAKEKGKNTVCSYSEIGS